jgi:hypothetical protein
MAKVLSIGEIVRSEQMKMMNNQSGSLIPKFIIVKDTNGNYFGAQASRNAGGMPDPAYAGASATSLAIAIATKVFVLTAPPDTAYIPVGTKVRAASASDPANKWMQGAVSSYDSGTGELTIIVDTICGSTTHADWLINIAIYNQWQAIIQPVAGTGDGIIAALENGDEVDIEDEWLVGQSSEYPNLDTFKSAIEILDGDDDDKIRKINFAHISFTDTDQPTIKEGRADTFIIEFSY